MGLPTFCGPHFLLLPNINLLYDYFGDAGGLMYRYTR